MTGSCKLEKLFKWCFIIFMLFMILAKAAYLFDVVSTELACVGTAVIAVICALVFKYWSRVYDWISDKLRFIDRINYKTMLLVIAVVSIVTKVLAVFVFRIQSVNDHSDIGSYVQIANELAKTGKVTTYAAYILSFDHMFWFGVFLSPVAYIFGDSQAAFSVYMSVIMTVSLILLFSVCVKKLGKNKSFVIFLLFDLLPSTILLPQYITHEIALLFFESIAVWLYFRVMPCCTKKSVRCIMYALFIYALFSATLMNAVGIVMCIAFVIMFLVKMLREFSKEALVGFLAKTVILIMAIIFGTAAMKNVQFKHSELPEDYVLYDKYIWTLYIGSNAQSGGVFTTEDQNYFKAYNADHDYDEIEQYRKEILAERYRGLFSEPSKLLHLIKAKLVSTWAAFDYPILYANSTISNQKVQRFYSHYLDRIVLFFEYGISVLAAVIGLYETIKNRHKYDLFKMFIRLYLMGATAMLMITECRNKYTIALQAFFWIICFADCKRNERQGDFYA